MEACSASFVGTAMLTMCAWPVCRAKGAQAVMSENVARMEERGEKLRNLQDKTEDLGDDAMDFASMAKQLAAQQANRKWWQM